MANPWIVHVKAYAKKHNLKYIDALKSGDCKKQYGTKNGGGDGPAQDGSVEPVQDGSVGPESVGQTPALNGGMADFKPQTGGKKSAKKSRKSRKTRKARKSKK